MKASLLALAYVLGLALLGWSMGCGHTVTLRTEQVPSASRMQWEEEVSDRINKMDERLKKIERGDTDA